MNSFVLYELNRENDTILVVCLTYESILNYLEELQKQLPQKDGIVIIDQLLVCGNGKNRFIECKYKNGVIDLYSAIAIKVDDDIKSLTSRILSNKKEAIEKSILTEKQKEFLKEGKIV